MAFALLNRRPCPAPPGLVLLALGLALTAAVGGLAFLSFSRKVATFRTAGFVADREGDALVVRSVEQGGAAEAAGIRPGDRIVLADGRTAASLARPEKALARRPFPHHVVVVSGGSINARAIREPAVRPDFTYLFLALVGVLYLVIGLFTVARERAPASRVFWALCLSSFAVYVVTPAGPHDAVWKLSGWPRISSARFCRPFSSTSSWSSRGRRSRGGSSRCCTCRPSLTSRLSRLFSR